LVSVEGFLVDLHQDKMLGSFRYLTPSSGPQHRFLTDVLGGTVAPQFESSHNVRTGDVERVTVLVGVYTVLMVVLVLVSIPVAQTLHRQQQRLAVMKEDGEYPDVLRCPECGQFTDSLKHYKLLQFGLFVVVAGTGQMDHVTACPRCMRRIILRRFFVNLVTANLLMIFFGPALLFQYGRTFWRGHSPDAVEQRGAG
jgi:hypothetical protein